MKLHNRYGTLWIFYPPNRTWGITMAENKNVTTCKLSLQTMIKGGIWQHLINPDTMSTLISDTIVSRAEPPPFGWTDIILKQTFQYWNKYQCTKANFLIM